MTDRTCDTCKHWVGQLIEVLRGGAHDSFERTCRLTGQLSKQKNVCNGYEKYKVKRYFWEKRSE